MKVVIYARYSSDNRRKIEGQIRECTALPRRTVSPSCATPYRPGLFRQRPDNRPEFQNMIKDGKRLFDVIIVQSWSRFARNRYDSAWLSKAALKERVKVVSATEVISFPTGPRVSFWKACWRATPNTTPPTCPKR